MIDRPPTQRSRMLRRLRRLWRLAALAPVNTSADAMHRTALMPLRRLVVGRRMAVPLDTGDLTLTVTEFDSRLDVTALSAGRLARVQLSARDIHWHGGRFAAATAVLHDVTLRPSTSPVLAAGPVELTLDVTADGLEELFRWAAPRLAGAVGPDSVARLRLAARPTLGSVDVDAHLDGSTLWLRPRGVTLRRTRWALPGRTPGYRVRLPDLPHGLQLTGVSFTPGTVRLTGTLPQWRMRVPGGRLESLLGQLGAVGRPSIVRLW